MGRDTSSLSPQEVRIAALETLAENLSDGVIAPLFWYLVLGVPPVATSIKTTLTCRNHVSEANHGVRQPQRIAKRQVEAIACDQRVPWTFR